MTPVIFAPSASDDLEDIGDHIAKDSPMRAVRIVAELRRRAEQVGHMPRAYPSRDDLYPGLRAMTWKPFLVLFRVAPSYVEVLHIVHGARDLKRLFEA